MENKCSLLCSHSLMLTQIHSHMDPVPSLTYHISKIHFNIMLTPSPWSLSKFFLTGFPRTFSYTILPSTTYTTPSTIITVRYTTSPITYNKHHILWSSALCSFLQPPDTSYTLSSNSSLSSTPSNTTNPLCSPPSHFTPYNSLISKH